MTTSHQPQLALSDDATISAAVYELLRDAGESVADLAFHTRISTASLYRKLSGESPWRVSDLGALARRYRIQPGDLFLGSEVLAQRPTVDVAEDLDEARTGAWCAIRDSNPEPADRPRVHSIGWRGRPRRVSALLEAA